MSVVYDWRAGCDGTCCECANCGNVVCGDNPRKVVMPPCLPCPDGFDPMCCVCPICGRCACRVSDRKVP